jgi:bacillithiol biosynthesis cysteine-adding enzyme BshC
MSAPQATATSVLREAIEPGRLSWTRPLARAYMEAYAAVAPWFAGDPKDPAAWSRTIRRVQQASRDSMLTCRALARQLDQRSAPPAAKEAAAKLAHPATVVVITGQQAGAFGGPLYTLLKAVTTVQLARRLAADHKVTVVPVFWVDGEDHDWEEVRVAHLLTGDMAPADLSLQAAGGGEGPVARRLLDERVGETMAQLAGSLPATEFTSDLVARLARHYRAGVSMTTAFAGWMDELLGSTGLVVFDAADPDVKPAVGSLFAAELDAPSAGRLAREAAAAMRAKGYTPQVEPGGDAVALFYLDERGRRPIRRTDDGRLVVGDEAKPAGDLADEARAHPERFSPNVLLRPLVQDRLFPTVAYVAGPAEIAYQAQLGEVYRTFGIEQPLLYPRASATVLDSAAARFLDRYGLPLDALEARDESALNRLLEAQLPSDVDRLITEADTYLAAQSTRLKPAVSAVDPTLAGAADTTIERARETFGSLRHKVVQACKRRDQTLRRQFERARTLAFPGGQPQERVLNVSFFVNRYGPTLGERLIEVLPLDTDRHYVLTL